MQYLFATDAALEDAGLYVLARKHPEYSIVITKQQLDEIRKSQGVISLRDADFDEAIETLKKESIIIIEDEPESPLNDKEVMERLGPWYEMPEKWQRVNDITKETKRLVRGNEVLSMIVSRDAIEAYPTRLLFQVGKIFAMADKVGAAPVLLTGPPNDEILNAFGFNCVNLRQYRRESTSFLRGNLFAKKLPQYSTIAALLVVTILLLPWLGERHNAFQKAEQSVLFGVPGWVLAPVFIGVGVYLYYWRCRQRFSYGLAEVLVGAVGVYVKVPQLDARAEIDSWVTLLFAVYIIVRGLDNVGQGLKLVPNVDAKWRHVFGDNI